MIDFVSQLNEKQKEAVLFKEGPLMVIAGAGSGKTKVLTSRIANLIKNGVSPFHILALTFTNKAAKEMKQRIEMMLGDGSVRNLFIGTFHSIFARLLRRDAPHLGYPNDFSIYDIEDSKSVIKKILKDKNLDEKIYKVNTIYEAISSAKNNLISPQAYEADVYLAERDAMAKRPRMAEIYAEYSIRCFKNGAMDFDDLLYQMYLLITKFPDVLIKYQQKFHYILIDEFQDTNPIQYGIIKYFAAANENICVVGDDAQSIYSFRGATIENILKFEKDYPDVNKIYLEQNYRSSQTILQVANTIIANNSNQFEKNLWTENEIGAKIRVASVNTDTEEAKLISDSISELKLRYHQQNNDIAILYRTNSQSRSFEESLRKNNIPYKIYGGISFYQRKEIKDILSYLKIICNPKDQEALLRIINYPARGIGKTSMAKLLLFANNNDITLWETLQQVEQGKIKVSASKPIRDFVVMVHYFQSLLKKMNAYDLAIIVGKNSGLSKEIHLDKSVEGLSRYENLQELFNSIQEFVNAPNEDGEVEEKNLGQYLQQIALLTDADSEADEADSVKLMTVHSAKGLEFSNVFLVGIEDNIFPSWMSLNSNDDLEEERRLFYVAITRAKQNLWMTYANSRYQYGKLVFNEPSQFIQELPEEHLDLSRISSRSKYSTPKHSNYNKYRSGNTEKHIQTKNYVTNKSTLSQNHIPSDHFEPSDIDDMMEGSRVEHKKFGYGTIQTLEGSAHNRIATILFETNGTRKIMLSYAKMRLVG